MSSRLQDGDRLVSQDVTLKFVSRSAADSLSAVTCDSVSSIGVTGVSSDVLTLLTDCVPADHSFNEAVYHQHLNTRVLGNVILYADVTTTTVHLLEGSVTCPIPLRHYHTTVHLLEGSVTCPIPLPKSV